MVVADPETLSSAEKMGEVFIMFCIFKCACARRLRYFGLCA